MPLLVGFRAKRAIYSALKLDGSWTKPMGCGTSKAFEAWACAAASPVSHQQTKSHGELLNWSVDSKETKPCLGLIDSPGQRFFVKELWAQSIKEALRRPSEPASRTGNLEWRFLKLPVASFAFPYCRETIQNPGIRVERTA